MGDVGSWQSRQLLWALVAEAFRYPDAGFAQRLESNAWYEELNQVAPIAGGSCGDAANAHGVACPDQARGISLEALRRESTRLFVGAPEPVCSPYEGAWRCAEEGVEHFQFINKYSMSVERFCFQCGLERPEGSNEPLDHIATEMELLSYLSWRAVQPAENTAQYPGGSAKTAYQEFIRDHLMAWLPMFTEKLREQAAFAYLPYAARIAIEVASSDMAPNEAGLSE